MDASGEPCVLVGIDESEAAEQALDWAAEEAHRRGARLLIAHVVSMSAYHLPDAFRGETADGFRGTARELLERSRERVGERYPELTVTTELLDDEPVWGLTELADDADVLVVGSRGTNPFAALLGSVSHALAAHASIPVVVVRHRKHDEPAAQGGEVVLGVAPEEAYGPVEFAFAEAQRRGTGVLAVRTWMYPQTIPGSIVVPPGEARENTARETADVEELLAGARKAFPEVPVRVETGLGQPETALVEASRNAALVVVGSRRHRRRLALPVGRVTSRVLHHAHSPVAVVPV
jgi:nucleotide-binding universal stress UspA family protein